MDHIERMRRAQKRGQQGDQRKVESPRKAESPRKITNETVLHSCGHTAQLNYFKKSKCPKCHKADRRKRAQARAQQQNGWRGAFQKRGRLPEKSEFSMVWDGQQWHGTLTVHVKGIMTRFSASNTAVFRLMVALDDMYREKYGQ